MSHRKSDLGIPCTRICQSSASATARTALFAVGAAIGADLTKFYLGTGPKNGAKKRRGVTAPTRCRATAAATDVSELRRNAQAIFRRRRHQPRRRAPAKIRPGSPAPALRTLEPLPRL